MLNVTAGTSRNISYTLQMMIKVANALNIIFKIKQRMGIHGSSNYSAESQHNHSALGWWQTEQGPLCCVLSHKLCPAWNAKQWWWSLALHRRSCCLLSISVTIKPSPTPAHVTGHWLFAAFLETSSFCRVCCSGWEGKSQLHFLMESQDAEMFN